MEDPFDAEWANLATRWALNRKDHKYEFQLILQEQRQEHEPIHHRCQSDCIWAADVAEGFKALELSFRVDDVVRKPLLDHTIP